MPYKRGSTLLRSNYGLSLVWPNGHLLDLQDQPVEHTTTNFADHLLDLIDPATSLHHFLALSSTKL